MTVSIEALTEPDAIRAAIPSVAALRIEVFAEWPYLYDGDAAYERDYLAHYAEAAGAVVVVARDGAEIVGAATGAPMASQLPEWSAPFSERGYPLDAVFYCGESVLRAAYRGRGIGHAFFDRREAQARALGARWSAFCGVVRAPDDPRRPDGARALDPFWRARGYAPMDGVVARFSWREHGDDAETEKPLQFWIRAL